MRFSKILKVTKTYVQWFCVEAEMGWERVVLPISQAISATTFDSNNNVALTSKLCLFSPVLFLLLINYTVATNKLQQPFCKDIRGA